MPHETLLLIGRETARATTAFETHARRLRDRDLVDDVRLLTYGEEPRRTLTDAVADLDTDRVVAVPLTVAHDHTTLRTVPTLLDDLDATVRYCEPVGRNALVTAAIEARAAAAAPTDPGTSVALVAAGSSRRPYQRQVTEYHAERLRRRSAFGEVVPCYLRQNPAVECVRYNLTGDHAVAVPLFLSECPATADYIPEKLQLGRGGLTYAAPLGDHEHVTEAIVSTVETERALDTGPTPQTFEETLTATARAMATDGEGR
ncbi:MULTISPECIES: CbiX/SirB N-terminal domain-containing protein [Haloarcula]|uniref:Sirohydrochlorin ferrochelatase n=1 Tax=Haloarcula pellucida TaxID=1427151 RepID=A0A830GJI9_9EURY|nr:MULTISPECIES: CbiX/SirB N-terminal domain-containing protein [Halomicroarcula]MBX0350427.1 sirohydrochlorin chelatase [Halomicroarcula pellucida]MDS0278732.1 sirohydrochlorin chelatase [Halomicroarcula sp. S1AR25-4]GGN90936.1 hypothetical protein GCM10009030_13410 [Halomicroarcula pellucida]